jgi:hypothetical protein
MRWLPLGLVIATVGCFAGCAGRRSNDAESPTLDTAPGSRAEPGRDDTVLVPEPRASDDTATGEEPESDQHEAPAPPPPVDVATLPPGPVSCSDCGSAPGYPSWQCPDGVHQGGRGPCVKLVDGRCGWIHLVCAAPGPSAACKASECGASPSPPQWRCPDGEHYGEFKCVRSEEGRCGWTERACLGRSNIPPRPATTFQTQPPPFRAPCDPLPSVRELRSWPVVSICQPGGGPHPPRRHLVLSLGDETHIFEDARGCFRARYRRCFSK